MSWSLNVGFQLVVGDIVNNNESFKTKDFEVCAWHDHGCGLEVKGQGPRTGVPRLMLSPWLLLNRQCDYHSDEIIAQSSLVVGKITEIISIIEILHESTVLTKILPNSITNNKLCQCCSVYISQLCQRIDVTALDKNAFVTINVFCAVVFYNKHYRCPTENSSILLQL
jgi:hypothetical protein